MSDHGVDFYDVQAMLRDERSEIRGEIDNAVRDACRELRAEFTDAIRELREDVAASLASGGTLA